MSLDKALFNIIANKYTMFLATMPVDKIDLNPTLNVEVQDEHEVSLDRPKAKIWWENHKSTTHNTADCRNPPRDPPRDDDANQDQSEEAQLSNLFKGLVAQGRK